MASKKSKPRRPARVLKVPPYTIEMETAARRLLTAWANRTEAVPGFRGLTLWIAMWNEVEKAGFKLVKTGEDGWV